MNNQKNGKPSVTGVLLAAFMFIVTLLPVPAFAAGNIPVTVDIRVTYNVDGNDGSAGGDRFTLTADDPGAPMPEGTVGRKGRSRFLRKAVIVSAISALRDRKNPGIRLPVKRHIERAS